MAHNNPKTNPSKTLGISSLLILALKTRTQSLKSVLFSYNQELSNKEQKQPKKRKLLTSMNTLNIIECLCVISRTSLTREAGQDITSSFTQF